MERTIQDDIRDHYGASARKMLDALDRGDAGTGAEGTPTVAPIAILPVLDAPDSCCEPAGADSSSCCDPNAQVFGPDLYAALDRASLPDAAVLASLGCGNPTAVADLRPGETVLDLGSGGGIDVLLSARRVGPTGRAIGLDMTDDMLELARRNADAAGATNVEFVRGTIEEMPLPDASVDVVISNCVINLSADKDAVFREIARVLRPGGRMGVSDVIAEDELSEDERRERGSWAACYAGALSFAEYRAGLEAAGLEAVEIMSTHLVADRMHAAIVQARKPAQAGRPACAPRAGSPGRA
jgi:arsenite methyltransferase